jgi:hypothetical protein
VLVHGLAVVNNHLILPVKPEPDAESQCPLSHVTNRIDANQCPLWIISGHYQRKRKWGGVSVNVR